LFVVVVVVCRFLCCKRSHAWRRVYTRFLLVSLHVFLW